MKDSIPTNEKGEFHGYFEGYDVKTGALQFTTTFKNGKENGIRTFYNPDGTLSSITNIVGNMRVGYEIMFLINYTHKGYYIR